MTAPCPSDLALERHLLDPERSPLPPHLADCPGCTERLAEMRRQGEEFLRYVYPATVAAVEAAALPRRWRPGRWLLLGPALAAGAAALLLLLRPAGPTEVELLARRGLGLAVLVQEGDAVRAVRDGERVGATSTVRFRVQATSACRLWILSLDSRGEFARLYPGEGTGGAAVNGPVDLPAGAVLDGQPGPERIYAICTPGPSRWRALAALLKGDAGPGEATVRATPRTAALPPGTRLVSVLLEKRT